MAFLNEMWVHIFIFSIARVSIRWPDRVLGIKSLRHLYIYQFAKKTTGWQESWIANTFTDKEICQVLWGLDGDLIMLQVGVQAPFKDWFLWVKLNCIERVLLTCKKEKKKKESMNVWINEWKEGWMNVWINEWIKEWIKEWIRK